MATGTGVSMAVRIECIRMRPVASTPLAPYLRSLVSICTLTCCGCVSVHITDHSGQVQVVRHVGYVQIQTAPGTSVTGAVVGVGLVGAPLGWSLGYTTQRWALLGQECRLVVWLPAGPIDAATMQALAAAGGACVLGTDAERMGARPMETTR